jgi:aminoglycoside phosphotransferase family enzyme
MIERLLEPGSLPDGAGAVTLVQTHISSVLVTEDFVYKIKKPVNFGFLDFSTLEKRKFYCLQELRLNQRLSRGIYLDVLPVVQEGDRYRIAEGGGTIVDYAVKMKRIPQEVLMKSMFREGRLGKEDLDRVANVLAAFHSEAERSGEIDGFGEPERFKINTDENFAQTEKYADRTIRGEDLNALRTWTNDFYRQHDSLFRERIRQGRIRDCHGDLHMEHICLTDPVSIIDCIEFNDRFRYSDTLSDVAFLLMDLEYHGGRDLAAYLWQSYGSRSGEGHVEDLLTFYKVYRAYVRGKVISFQSDDERLPQAERERIAREAAAYFALARSYI